MTSKKESQFTVQTIVSDTDFVRLFRLGTNLAVPFSSFKSALGVTGTIKQVGDSLAAPVLDAVGDTFNIRNLESTKGVSASVSASNGIALAANFSQPAGGFNLIEDLNAKIYKFRGVKGIAPIEVNLVNDFLEFSQATSPLAQTNTVIVSDISDFPAPITGVITLEDDIDYVIVQEIITSNRFVLGTNNAITSNNFLTPVFRYTGTGTFFTGVDKSLNMYNILLDVPNGQVFDISATGPGAVFSLTLVVVTSCEKFGTFDDLGALDIINCGVGTANDGITVSGVNNWSIFSIIKLFFDSAPSASFVGVDFNGSIHNTLEVSNLVIRGVAGGIGVKGAAGNANLAPNSLATVHNGEFLGGMTAISGIQLSDIRWSFQFNAGLRDSASDALLSLTANTTETVISAQNTPVKVLGTWVIEGTSHFSGDTNGTVTYTGERDNRLNVDIEADFLMASGGDKEITVYIAINGSIVSQTGEQITVSSTKAAIASMIWQYTFSIGDFVELFVENNDDATNIICQQSVKRIS